MAKKQPKELQLDEMVFLPSEHSEFPTPIPDPIGTPIENGIEIREWSVPEELPTEVTERGLLWMRLADLGLEAALGKVYRLTPAKARRLKDALAQVRRELAQLSEDAAQTFEPLRRSVEEALRPFGGLLWACQYERQLKRRLSDEVGFFLAAYGVPITIYKNGPAAKSLRFVFREAGLSHLFPSERGKEGGMGDRAGSDLSRILRTLARKWTAEATVREIEKRREAMMDEAQSWWAAFGEGAAEED